MIDDKMGLGTERLDASGVTGKRPHGATRMAHVWGWGVQAAIAGALVLLTASEGSAGFKLNYDPTFASNEKSGARATVEFDFQQLDPADSGTSKLKLVIRNTSDEKGLSGKSQRAAQASKSTLSVFGFDLIDGVLLAPIGSNDEFPNFSTNVTIPSGKFSSVDVMMSSDGGPDKGNSKNAKSKKGKSKKGKGKFLGGPPNGGLTVGSVTEMEFELQHGHRDLGEVEAAFLAGFEDETLETFARFMRVDGSSSGQVGGGIVPTTVSTATQVSTPEPSSFAIWGVCLGAFGLVIRRRVAASK